MFPATALRLKAVWTESTRVKHCTSVNRNMTFQVKFDFKLLTTKTTVVRHFAAVEITLVVSKYFGIFETFLTNWAGEWPDIWMNYWMLCQMRWADKCFCTHMTFERFLTTVNPAVQSKCIRSSELFPANCTLKQSFSWVGATMSLQCTIVWETFSTYMTAVITFVNVHMHLSRTCRRKILFTNRTLIAFCFIVWLLMNR